MHRHSLATIGVAQSEELAGSLKFAHAPLTKISQLMGGQPGLIAQRFDFDQIFGQVLDVGDLEIEEDVLKVLEETLLSARAHFALK